ncbi:ADP-ribosylation factor-related protein 1 isoform X1 [Prionailurus bengalensis]|uniref:ADP-ribosylation factor-related protein 1 isoform X1 n=2 Tax=Acinonyx jubatus TaxID=32536 RepID=A0A6J1YBT1_ACIJB|nr:ADP-ribosylation factor-related protein 1 isoform X1 [Felis catus]XP_023106720.1 ADP-ribosylation factor-related protein 1 isoform X1 [Felis catus]XP_026902480.1 ADP-ribosylation factor-related protein 1 isoform X1 [Acinonyx jubatus]XP_026902481.1 ADP-ribosylation factor-related protein 1 isoform X1 [Acinonyx jubatus]XP_043409364.1 ADP-ribosylation factor-related protein 1 isoform X1 [Prionailurus bengalensis]XP_043409370.1 ADP-ribosylation factor-related protein 1 isoform X1 [Prionailurus 
MYTLLSGLYKYMFQKDEYCILILGLDNAGKTTFLEQSKTRFNKNYKGMSLSKITTTVGLNIGTVDVGKARLMFWDLGGQEELQSLWDKAPRKGLPVGGWPWGGQVPVAQHPLSAPPQYYAECHGVIYVIDSTDEERLSESKRAFEKMVTSEALDGVPILVLANKQDVEQRGARGHRVDGEVRRAERAPAAAAEGHHVGMAGACWCPQLTPECPRSAPASSEPPGLGVGFALLLVFSVALFFL